MRGRSSIPLLACLAGCSFNPAPATGDATTSPDSSDDAVDLPAALDAPAANCFARWKDPSLELTEPSPLVAINSIAEDRDPFISNDELTIYFASRRNGSQGADVYRSSRATTNVEFPGATKAGELNVAEDDTKLAMSGNELIAVLASRRPGGDGNSDVWLSNRLTAATPFTGFTQVGITDANDAADQLDPELSFDGLSLYLAVGSPQRIAISRRTTVVDPFPAPLDLIADPAGDADPALSPDEVVIVFSSNRVGSGQGGSNLWYATRGNKNGPFNNATPVPTVNTGSNEGDPALSRDGCRLYFASDRGVAGFDIFVSEVIP